MESTAKLIKAKAVAFIFEMVDAMKDTKDSNRRGQAAALVMAQKLRKQFKETHSAATAPNYALKLQQFDELIQGIKSYL